MNTTSEQGFEASGGSDGPWPAPDALDAHERGTGRASTPGVAFAFVLAALFGLAIIAAVVVHLMFDAHQVMSLSMEPTYEPDDRVLSRPVSEGDVKRGDVVLMARLAGVDIPRDVSVIRRVVAVGGDTVEEQDGRLVVNGEVVDEEYLADGMETQNLEPVAVSDGFVYLLGDNRINSQDSRQYGPVPEGDVASVVALDWSLDRWTLGAAAVLGVAFLVALVRMTMLRRGRRLRR